MNPLDIISGNGYYKEYIDVDTHECYGIAPAFSIEIDGWKLGFDGRKEVKAHVVPVQTAKGIKIIRFKKQTKLWIILHVVGHKPKKQYEKKEKSNKATAL